MAFKQVIILRQDLRLSTGKLISQACHAAVGAYRRASDKAITQWQQDGGKKIAVSVPDAKELNSIYSIVSTMNIPAYLVEDAGQTEIPPGTRTAIGIGPAAARDIDKITGELTLV